MKKVYVNKDTLKEAVDYLNDEITFFGFLSNLKLFLKELLINPINADINDYLKRHGINKTELLNKLIERNIIEKETNIKDKENKDVFTIRYKIPKRNFERKIRRLYCILFENDDCMITEDGEGSVAGATSCSSSGQYTCPLGGVQRRKIYVTQEQSELLKEMGTQDAGNYQYDVSFKFNNGADPAYNHKNMIKQGIPQKKKGVRFKKK